MSAAKKPKKSNDFLSEYLRTQTQKDKDAAVGRCLLESKLRQEWWIKHIPRGKFPKL